MSQALTSRPQADTGRSLPKPPSIFRTGARLPEVRWATIALVLFVLGAVAQLTGAPAALWWSLYLACYVVGGWDPALSGLRALREKTLDVDLLMIVAAIAAAAIGQVFEGALLIVIFATSGAMEALVTQRTANSVSSLLDLAPERATRMTNDGAGPEEEMDTADLQVGDVILVRPGERIGADGTVVRGVSEVDQSAMTGESVPVVRREGDEVLSGTVNGSGVLSIRVAKAAKDSVVSPHRDPRGRGFGHEGENPAVHREGRTALLPRCDRRDPAGTFRTPGFGRKLRSGPVASHHVHDRCLPVRGRPVHHAAVTRRDRQCRAARRPGQISHRHGTSRTHHRRRLRQDRNLDRGNPESYLRRFPGHQPQPRRGSGARGCGRTVQ